MTRRAAQRVEWFSTFFAEAPLVAVGMPATVAAAGHDRKLLGEVLRFID